MSETTMVEANEAVRIWTRGAHTVTSLEVQAVQIHARLCSDMLSNSDWSDLPHLGTVAGFLSMVADESERVTAAQLLRAKEHEVEAGREVVSGEPIRQ